MNTQLNQFFLISSLVTNYQDSEFFTFHYYQKKIEAYLTMTLAILGFCCMVVGIATNITPVFITGISMAIALFAYTQVSNTRVVQFLTKHFAELLFGLTISMQIRKERQEIKDALYELRPIIQTMKTNGIICWAGVANKAEKILGQF